MKPEDAESALYIGPDSTSATLPSLASLPSACQTTVWRFSHLPMPDHSAPFPDYSLIHSVCLPLWTRNTSSTRPDSLCISGFCLTDIPQNTRILGVCFKNKFGS